MSGAVRTERAARAGRITLDRPARLNALTLDMVRAVHAALDAWDADPAVGLVLIDGEGPRGFCAGGDIRAASESIRAGDGAADVFFRAEYRLNARIARFPKPIVAFMTGITMGGGVGLSAHARHRIVTDDTALAMPEAGIGLIPDVGSTWLLSRAPGETGTWMALTGGRIGAADAIAAGFADAFVPQEDLPALRAALLACDPAAHGGIAAVIDRFARTPGPAVLPAHQALIDAAFGHDDVAPIVAALGRAAPGDAFAAETARKMAANSPTSLALALRALREARRLDSVEACIALEYRLVARITRGHDFHEGVRAAVVDKDRAPRWRPAELGGVTDAAVAGYFATLGDAELTF